MDDITTTTAREREMAELKRERDVLRARARTLSATPGLDVASRTSAAAGRFVLGLGPAVRS